MSFYKLYGKAGSQEAKILHQQGQSVRQESQRQGAMESVGVYKNNEWWGHIIL
ncbi:MULTISPECIES: hypothetical protein [unclassified Acinetobacter]|uniref:hypothetical protein n=1 Tax=unclassified Acinetobacter TaxID=196816 RepID=UPI002447937A|nr:MULTISPECIES: hypothetical protein [unclassified Acinetobacter]MDH0032685.1 hypothetical protein [Acinetobacter sp. GD04021]MDH0888120.1 hypothetical protein [Acinetobacter sp. GD03873]MDH1084471.1 hypothetical protein [Acinetobacter sp. GD03983]MDH2191437.1 hypothetical protein [Acinetobacter sp. GD03645]MDH2205010.1 hypothetical protein [Acinetobacter sp. GD03647]